MITRANKRRIGLTWPWVEAFFITGCTLLVGFWLNPSDPFFFHAPFPWTWFATTLIALRYGFASSFFSYLLIIITMFLTLPSHAFAELHLRLYVLSGFILMLICSEYSNTWNKRIKEANLFVGNAETSMVRLANEYFTMRLSHDRLEQNLINKPVTLRTIMQELRASLVQTSGTIDSSIGNRLLQLLANYCSLEVCSLHLMDKGQLIQQPLASLGRNSAIMLYDPLLQSVLNEGHTSYRAINSLEEQEQGHYLVVAPITNADAEISALLLIEQMSFLNLQDENLQILSVILSYFADSQWAANKATKLLATYPTCPNHFAAEIFKLSDLKNRENIDSTLVSLEIYDTQLCEHVIRRVQQQQRGLDCNWHLQQDQKDTLITLMPFTEMKAVGGYIDRIRNMVLKEMDIVLNADNHKFNIKAIGKQKPLQLITDLLGS